MMSDRQTVVGRCGRTRTASARRALLAMVAMGTIACSGRAATPRTPAESTARAETVASARPGPAGGRGAAASPAPAAMPPEPVAPKDEWAALSWDDRHDAMTFDVLPTMGQMFQRFRGSSAPDMTCRTCHGADAESVAYAMPHGLPALDPAQLPRADDPDPRRARIARFMIEEVTPTMGDLLGVSPYDPATGKGFGCFNCHPARKVRP